MRPRRNCADLGINDQGSTPSYARSAILPVGMAALHVVGVEARMPRGRASEIFLCAARVVVVAPLGQSAQHGATDGDALSLAVPERSVLSMRLISLIGRPGVEVSLYARLLSARLRAELLAVPPAAAAEVAHGTHLGKQLSAAAADAVGKPLPSNLVAPLIMPKLQRAAQLQAPLVLSGFPRNLDQLTMLQQAGVPTLPTVVHLELPRVIAERRLADRHICANCGEPMRRIEPPTTGEGAVPAGLWATARRGHRVRRALAAACGHRRGGRGARAARRV